MSTATLTRPTPALPPVTTASAALPGEVVVDRAQLGWALEQCARLGRNGYGLPWTSRVLITTRDRTLTVTRSNGDADLTATIPTTTGRGGTRVPALAALRALVALLDGDDVTLTFHRHSETLGVTCGAAAYTLACIPPDTHPAGGQDPERQLTIATPLVAATIAAVRRVLPFAATTQESRAVLTVAAIHDRQAVATDSYRLAVADLTPDTAALPPMLIPAAPLARVLRGGDDGWTATHHPGAAAPDRLELTRDRIAWRTRLLEGKFPDWTTLLPADPAAGGTVTVDRAAAVRALRRLTAVAGYGIPVTLTTHRDGELRIVLNRGDDGDGTETLPCTGGLAEPVAFNPRYLTAALASLTQPAATLANPGDNRPALFTEPGYRHLLMPVRL